ncbi:TPA: hypothetical protein U2L31_005529 [Burkholderia contaminans]|nr:hypothetical protein [Burkholderia contaminans]
MPEIAENINEPTLGLFQNMPFGHELDKLHAIGKIIVDKVINAGKVFVSLARLCATSFLVVAAFVMGFEGRPAVFAVDMASGRQKPTGN